jgi:phosphomannomutase
LALIKSISGIRGTIGGKPGESLTPLDVVKYTAAFGEWAMAEGNNKIIIGRDGRISGPMIAGLVAQTLVSEHLRQRTSHQIPERAVGPVFDFS